MAASDSVVARIATLRRFGLHASADALEKKARTMDDADITAERLEREQAALLARRKPTGAPANGECHWCGARVEAGHRYCDADCARDHERAQAAKLRNSGGAA